MTVEKREVESVVRTRERLEQLREEARARQVSHRKNIPVQLTIMHIGGIAATVAMGAVVTTNATAIHVEASRAASCFGVGLAVLVLCMLGEWMFDFLDLVKYSRAIRGLDRGSKEATEYADSAINDRSLGLFSSFII